MPINIISHGSTARSVTLRLRMAIAVVLVAALSLPSLPSSATPPSDPYTDLTASAIHERLVALVQAHPDLAKLTVIGTTVEGRQIEAIELSDAVETSDPSEGEVLVLATEHAREVGAPSAAVRLAESLVGAFGSDPDSTRWLCTLRIVIVPVVNVDGFVFDEGHNDWRKNRRDNGDGTIGVDLNRNFAFQWGYDDLGSSGIGGDFDYRGTAPFSEPESRALRDLALNHSFDLSVNLHSYGRSILYPYGYADVRTPDDDWFVATAEAAALAAPGYEVLKGTDLYPTNGETDDWLYATLGVRSFTIEIGDSFYPPPEWLPTEYAQLAPALFALLNASRTVPSASAISDAQLTDGDGLDAQLSSIGDLSLGGSLGLQVAIRNGGDAAGVLQTTLQVRQAQGGALVATISQNRTVGAGSTATVPLQWQAPLSGGGPLLLEVTTSTDGDADLDNGRWHGPLTLDGQSGVVLLGPNSAHLTQGQQLDLPLQLRNIGAAPQQVTTTITRADGGVFPRGIDVVGGDLLIAGGAQVPVVLHLHPGADTPTGDMLVQVCATSPDASATHLIAMQVDDGTPTAVIVGPSALQANAIGSYSAELSSAPGSPLVRFAWSLDGVAVGDLPILQVGPLSIGTHLLAVAVTSASGLSGNASRMLEVDVSPSVQWEVPTLLQPQQENATIVIALRNPSEGAISAHLRVQADSSLVASLPDAVDLPAGASTQIPLDLRLDARAPVGSDHPLTVYAQPLGSTSQPVQAQTAVRIPALERARLDAVGGLSLVADGGAAGRVSVQVTNSGNVELDLHLTSATAEPWHVQVEPAAVRLHPGESTRVNVTLPSSSQRPAQERTVPLVAQTTGGTVLATLPLRVRQLPMLHVEGVVVTIPQLRAGGTATVTIRLTNGGNVAARASLLLPMPSPGGISIEPAHRIVPPGATLLVDVPVRATNAAAGQALDHLVLHLTATEGCDCQANGTVQVGLRVGALATSTLVTPAGGSILALSVIGGLIALVLLGRRLGAAPPRSP